MNKIVFLYLLLSNIFIFSQSNSGEIIYQFKFGGIPFQEKSQNKTAQQAITKMYEALLNYSGKINYKLTFNENLSEYKILESLNSDNDKNINNVKNLTGAGEVVYIDTKKKLKFKLLDFFGDDLMVKDSLDDNWNLTQESKKIGNFICYKAWLKNERNVLIEAWYTPQIPLNIGPRGYGNLPGLIIELKQASLLYVAKEIVLNSKKIPIIKIPNKKIINEKDFNKMLSEFDRKKRN